MRDGSKHLELIAGRIRELRSGLRLTQAEFAEKLKQDQTTISKWERAKARPTPEALLKLASLASGIDALFFLEHAGLPEQYFLGKPMIPEIAAASARVVDKAISFPKGKGAVPSKQEEPAIAWDPELITFVIETMDLELKRRKRMLPIGKYAELIILVYEYCHKMGRRDSDIVRRLLKIA